MFNSWFKARPLSEDLQKGQNRVNSKDTFQRGVDSRSGNIVVRDETHPRVFLGSLQEGNDRFYGVKVSQPGSDVTTAEDSDLIMSSAFNMFKIVDSGTLTVPAFTKTAPASQGSASYTYTHDLGYKPLVLAYVDLSGFEGMPWNYNAIVGINGSGTVTAILENNRYYKVTSTTVKFTNKLTEWAPGITPVFTQAWPETPVKFYLLRETSVAE